MKMMKHKGRQAGVTLMELIASLAVMAVIVVGAVALYTSATTSEKTTSLNRDVLALQTATKTLYSGQGTYGAAGTNLNNVLVTAKKVPTSITVDTTSNPNTLTHSANGTVNILSTGTSFEVRLTNITPELCVPLMTGASGWASVKIGTTAGGGTARVPPVAPATASGDCSVANATHMTFTN
jgi:prepilin-type N-terminal cleavage/methylation domain-containing protein